MKKSQIILVGVLTFLLISSIGANFYLYLNKNSSNKSQNEKTKCVVEYSSERQISDYDSNSEYTVTLDYPKSSFEKNSFLLSDTMIVIYENAFDCVPLLKIEYDSYKTEGANAIDSIKLYEDTLFIKYHINPNAYILRKITLSDNAREEILNVICNPEKTGDCTYTKKDLALRFLSTDQITQKLKTNICISNYLEKVKNVKIVATDPENDESLLDVHIYEEFPDHNATFGWVTINIYTGEMTDLINDNKEIVCEP
jgi:hypothetical protein